MSNNLWILFIAAAVAIWAIKIQRGSGTKYQNLNSEQLQKMLSDKQKISIIDVRTAMEYNTGHIPGATLRPLGKLEQWSKELSVEKSFVVVCASGHRSAAAIRKLTKLGFGNLYNLQGGMSKWKYKVVK